MSEYDEPRNGLGDYFSAVRRHRWLAGIVTGIVVAAFVGYSLTQPKVYSASALVLFRDPSQDVSLTGAPAGVFRTGPELAQIGATSIINPELIASVQRRLHTQVPSKQLMADLSASADPSSGQVAITATGPSAGFVTDLANAAAQIGAGMQADTERARYDDAARTLQKNANRLGRTRGDVNQRLTYDDQITRLRALAVLAQPVQVTSLATPPGAPTSPKPWRNGIIGLILGMMLGIVVSVARESFDRRLRSSQDVEEALELPILAHVGEEAMGKAGLSHSGLGALSDSELEAFRMLRTNLRFHRPDRTSSIVLVTSPMPKEGKSTVAASLAFSYAMAGQRTLLVECDFRRPTLAGRLGVRESPGLMDYLLGAASPAEVIQLVPDAPEQLASDRFESPAGPVPSAPLVVLVAGRRPEGQPAELLGSDRFATFLTEVSTAYDAIVLDSAPLLPVADTLGLISRADSIVLCVRSSQTKRDQATAAKAALEPAKGGLAGVVVTSVSVRERGYYGYYGYYGYRDQPTNNGKEASAGATPETTKPPRRLRDRLPSRR